MQTFIVDDASRADALRSALGRKANIIVTDGLLFDLPPPTEEMGVDILKDYQMRLTQIPGKAETVDKIKELVNEHVVVATTEADEGLLLAEQVYLITGIPLTKKVHFQPFCWDRKRCIQWQKHLKALDANRLSAIKTRRVIERIGGVIVTEALEAGYRKSKTVCPVVSLPLACILADLERKRHNRRDLRYGLRIEFQGGFCADLIEQGPPEEILKSRHRLPLMEFASPDDAQEFAAKDLDSNPPTEVIRKQSVIEQVRPGRMPTLSMIVEALPELSIEEILSALEELYSKGVIAYPWAEQTTPQNAIVEGVRAGLKELGLLALFQERPAYPKHAIRLLRWEDVDYFEYPAREVYQKLRKYSVECHISPLQRPAKWYLFGKGALLFCGAQWEGISEDNDFLRILVEEKEPSSEFNGRESYKFRVIESSADEWLKEWLQKHESLPSIKKLYMAIAAGLEQELLVRDKDKGLRLSSKGAAAGRILNEDFEHFLSLERWYRWEMLCKSIRAGILSYSYGLHWWYHGLQKSRKVLSAL